MHNLCWVIAWSKNAIDGKKNSKTRFRYNRVLTCWSLSLARTLIIICCFIYGGESSRCSHALTRCYTALATHLFPYDSIELEWLLLACVASSVSRWVNGTGPGSGSWCTAAGFEESHTAFADAGPSPWATPGQKPVHEVAKVNPAVADSGRKHIFWNPKQLPVVFPLHKSSGKSLQSQSTPLTHDQDFHICESNQKLVFI